MKNSEILREAKTFLYPGDDATYSEFMNADTSFVCFAINETSAPLSKKVMLRRYISNLIGRYSTVANWLHSVVGVPDKELTYNAVQDYRHRWVDHMIAEFEAKGD